MAEKQTAEEDDAEGFGEFKFAVLPQSTYSNPTTTFQSLQIKPLSFIHNSPNDDDEWGDFINNPPPLLLRSEPAPVHTSVRSLPAHPFKLIDAFKHFSNHSLNSVESDKKIWMKPQGALPLSLFGGVEEDGSRQQGQDERSIEKQVDLISGNEQIKVENGVSITSNGYDSILGFGNKIEQIKSDKELNLRSAGLNLNLNIELDDCSFVMNEVSYKGSEPVNVGSTSYFGRNGVNSTSHSNGLDLRHNRLESKSNVGDEDIDEDDGWGFQGANSGNDHEDLDSKGDQKKQMDLGVVDKTPSKLDIGFDFKPTTVTQNGFLIGSYPRLNHNTGVNGYSHKGDMNTNPDISFWDLKDNHRQKQSASGESNFLPGPRSANHQNECGSDSFPAPRLADSVTISKHKEGTNASDFSHGVYDGAPLDGQMQEGKMGILPMSLFREENMYTNDSHNLHNGFAFQSPSHLRNGISSQDPSISFDDLISNLYSQAAPLTTLTQEITICEVDSIPVADDSNEINNDGDEDNEDFDDTSCDFKGALSDMSAKNQAPVSVYSNEINNDGDEDSENFDDTLWDFKGATSDTIAENQAPVLFPGDIDTNSKMKTYVEFYTVLKDVLCQVVHFHLDNMKRAKTSAALSSDDAKLEALDAEIKEVYKQLNLSNILAEVQTEHHLPRISSLSHLRETLHEPMFQLLESEYCLASQIAQAEKDIKSTIALLSHSSSVLKIFNLCPIKEQAEFVSAWSRMIFVCSEELKHGASVLKQASQKSIYQRVLSDVRGQQFLLALGEIFRVVELIGVSIQIFKPWMLSNLDDSTNIFYFLKECSTIWSSIEESLHSVSDSFGSEYERLLMSVLESIKRVQDLDAQALQTNVLISLESTCQLTLLSSATVPELNMVPWNGQPYFVTIANLWANLIDYAPPKLAHIHTG